MTTEPGGNRSRARREAAAWVALIALNLISHFAMLGTRAMSHDEGIHSYYSYTLGRNFDYKHDPPYHGPLLYHLNALVYALAGDDDATARALPAVAGVALVAVLFLLRPLLGRFGAFAAALVVSLSPVMLFYGRYIRNDVYVSLFYVVWSLAAFRYLRGGNVRWLWGVTIPMALGFAAKEVTFIFGATIGAFFLAFGLFDGWRRRSHVGSRALDLAFWMLTLALPFGASLLGLPFGIDPGAFASGPVGERTGLILAAVGLAAGLALLRFRSRGAARDPARPTLRVWSAHFVAFWAFLITLFTTLFTNAPQGIFSGVLGSLGYWLAQQEVARGGQPAYYYVLLALLYETLALVLFLGGGLLLARRWRSSPRGASLLGSRLAFPAFCLWWGVAGWIGYSAAGERMPWLLVHIALPMSLLGGWAVAQLARGLVRRGPSPRGALVALAGSVPIGALLVAETIATPSRPALVTISRVLFAAAWLLFAWRARARVARGAAWRLLAAGALAGLALFSLRSSLRASFVNYDLAIEPLVYAHGTPDIKQALAEIDQLRARVRSAAGSGGAESGLEVTFDEEVTWPMLWYLRHLPGSRFAPDPRQLSAAVPVALVGPTHFQEAEAILGRTHVRRDYRLTWWPHEGYRGLTLERIAGILGDPARRRWLYDVVVHRRYEGIELEAWTHRSEFRLYIDRELAVRAWPVGLEALERRTMQPDGANEDGGGEALWCEAEAVYSAPFAGLSLAEPAAIAALPEGGVAVADVGNHRVVLLGADGALRRTLGRGCELARGEAGGCVDPDGPDGALPLGAGQFWQPWGVAVSSRGELAVADTWNGRVQLFDADGRFLWSWGRSALAPAGPPGEDESERLFGPRALAFDPTGERILVADTGNKRLVELSRSGERLREIAAPGSELGGFAEPIGVAFRAADGSLFVADAWNRRVLEAPSAVEAPGRGASTYETWRIAASTSSSRATGETTPYLASLPDGSLLASDPERHRLARLDPAAPGGVGSMFVRFGSLTLRDPVGVAVATDGRIWVSSRAGNEIWRLPPLADCRPAGAQSP